MSTITTEGPPPPPEDGELLVGPVWPDVRTTERPDRRVAAAVLVAAVGTDLAVRSGLAGLAGALLPAAVAGGIIGAGRARSPRAWPVLGLAAVLGAGLGLRAAGWLLALDVLASAGLLLFGSSLVREGDPLDQSIPDLVGRVVHAAVHAALVPTFVAAAGTRRSRRDRHPSSGWAVVRGGLLAAPVVLVIGLLLASADPVFASFFRFPTDAGDLVVHAVLLGTGGWGAMTLHRMASAAPYEVHADVRRPLGRVEALTVLAGLVAVFAAFTISQAVTAIRGADYVRRTAGLTYAEHARSGFFQLLVVAALTLGVLLALRAAVVAIDRRFVVLAEVAVVLTLLLVGGALRRLALYEQAYGLTLLRLFAVLFAVWIGGVFLLLAATLAGLGRRRAWFVPAALALGLAGLLVLNVANPEALLVRRNVDRLAGTDRFDPDAMAELSDDAAPVLLAALPRLSPDDAARVRAGLCAGRRPRARRSVGLQRRAARGGRRPCRGLFRTCVLVGAGLDVDAGQITSSTTPAPPASRRGPQAELVSSLRRASGSASAWTTDRCWVGRVRAM